MAEVHEITRTAYKGLALHDYCFGHGDFVVVSCGARFEGTPTAFHTVEYFEDECWAVRRAESIQDNALYYARLQGDYCNYYEVWHIVDDEPEPDKYGLYQRYALEAYLGDFVEEYDIDAIEDAVTVLDYSTGNRYWTMDDEGLAEYIAGLETRKRPDYYRVDMEGKGSAHFTEYEQACEFVDYMMHRPLGDSWCTFCEVWACWSDGTENWLEDHWRSMFDGRVFHMRDNDALENLGLN